ncbi:DNA replication and repair protein RecF [Pullulanibacillus pueri]|uniref:DNA replication and repair protein RecF n=1 Tax=Pullulanibacillus pueri TaxID=1437324 RepID=A0A8J2ZVJ1_9BACL|nr:DNA replication/repair protein RecF [Pullulanibacillus pueri]MBM7682162.1 DNA replication and repair protein RecF [Pullulanibacillus pueri]GGH80274.1 DNA replication and repair protein RecF [Pullulanibacillus pueri]
MYLETIQVEHFRNYERSSIDLSQSINVFIGENAQGKTNLLEAIYVLAMAKSHRTPHVKELIQWGQEYAKIDGRVKKNSGTIPLELTIYNKGRKAKANHIERKKLSQYVGLCNVVLFAPEDLRLVKDSPSHRRRFVDMEIGQIQPLYLHRLSEFQKVLQQRNALLKDLSRQTNPSTTMLEVLTEQMIELVADITHRRFYFIKLLREWAQPIHKSISHGCENLDIHYLSSTVDVSEEMDLSRLKKVYEKAFDQNQKREIDRGNTLIGPHRDDLKFIVNDKNIQTFGSQGQQRTTALSLKLAEIELIYNEVGEYPILLLDDVLSELDDRRQTHLLSTFKERVQTIVTTTNTDAIDHEMMQQARSFEVSQGDIIREK